VRAERALASIPVFVRYTAQQLEAPGRLTDKQSPRPEVREPVGQPRGKGGMPAVSTVEGVHDLLPPRGGACLRRRTRNRTTLDQIPDVALAPVALFRQHPLLA
jgi:hypothetical protein